MDLAKRLKENPTLSATLTPMLRIFRRPSKDPERFFSWLKTESERAWKHAELKDAIYGFQTQAGTCWLPGLTDAEIAAYESKMGFAFPEIFKKFLAQMNGTDVPGINIYGRSGEPYRYAPIYYSYPRDLEAVKERIAWVMDAFRTDEGRMEREQIPHIMPIVGHRFLIMDRWSTHPVLSMYEEDVVAYAENLQEFLIADIFEKAMPQRGLKPMSVKFWLEGPS